MDLPTGKPLFHKKIEDINNFFGFIRCKVTTNKKMVPLHGYKCDGKLMFSHHENTEMVLFSEEIK